MQESWMRFFVDNALRCTLVHIGMRFQLKEQVQHVDEKQNLGALVKHDKESTMLSHDTGSSADLEHSFVRRRTIGE